MTRVFKKLKNTKNKTKQQKMQRDTLHLSTNKNRTLLHYHIPINVWISIQNLFTQKGQTNDADFYFKQ